MLDPSSSEEEGDETLAVEHKEVAAQNSLGGARLSPGRAADGHGGRGGRSDGGGALRPHGHGCGGVRPSSPSPSVSSDKEKEDLEKMQREEEEKKKRLQLYVFVMRCIAYPFNAKQPTDMARRQQKVRWGVWGGGCFSTCLNQPWYQLLLPPSHLTSSTVHHQIMLTTNT